MLLVYGSELDPQQARNQLEGHLRKEYRIVRRTARHSELEAMSQDDEMAEEKKTILEEVVEKGGFKRDMDAATFAFALAVNRAVAARSRSRAPGRFGTWAALTKAATSKRLFRSCSQIRRQHRTGP